MLHTLTTMPKSLPSNKEDKHTVIFVSKAEHLLPSSISLNNSGTPQGLILSSGEINWMCPCLDGMATGPCGVEFREAFSCFHNSKAEPQGKDCLDAFRSMQECMQKYPQTYRKEEMLKQSPT
ncbi:mitochondrial intermembrane space import and assembly protein 40-B-like [Thrips palmi]|uniref:Mitochondrial intermembrane space import and assembly protein 40-B-like n=1 Tax=Thrips palmi TaxID=161013 RepID=A0A6P8ZXQ6_THRPL|nr:mitochondrial intermembrane space import and assembly protein 40-B-like [Thrips palmi]